MAAPLERCQQRIRRTNHRCSLEFFDSVRVDLDASTVTTLTGITDFPE